MSWKCIAEDVAMNILNLNPLRQDPGGVLFLRCALIGLGSFEDTPHDFANAATTLRLESNEQMTTPGRYPEWTPAAADAHRLAARLGDCLDEVSAYYEEQ